MNAPMKKTFIRSIAFLLVAGCTTTVKEQPIPAAGTVVSFTATPKVLANAGAKATLSWTTKDATVITLEQVGVGPVAIDGKAASSSVEVTLTKDALFVLTARGEGGTDSRTTSVEVKGGATGVVFDAVPRAVPAGGFTTLVWSAPGATAVTLKEVGGSGLDLMGQLTSGSVRVGPLKSTTYELTVDGKALPVTVEVASAIFSFELSGTAPDPGGMLTLAWETSGGSKLTITREGVTAPLLTETDAIKILSGTVTDTVPASAPVDGLLHYTLELQTGAVKTTQKLTVRIGGSVTINAFNLPAYAKATSTFTVNWNVTGADRLELFVNDVSTYLAPDAASVAAGSVPVQASASGTVTVRLRASNVRGAVAEQLKSTSVVGIASIATFTATPSTVAAGGTATTLAWNAPSARRVKITGSTGHTVKTVYGPAAEAGSVDAYPNGAVTYTLEADNTIDAPVTATQAVTVTVPAVFGPAAVAPVFAGNPVNLVWTVGTSALVYGAAHTAIATQAASSGFIDIATTGARLPFAAGADDAVLTFTPLDFESFLYGNRVSGPVTVSTNGFFVFASTAATRSATVAIPNATIERNFIAPFWTNLELGPSGKVFWKIEGDAPERVLVVQFDQVRIKGDAFSVLTFQGRVHQTGVVSFEYKTLTTTAASTPVIGVQGAVSGLAATSAASAVGLTLFGPVPSPVSVTATTAGQLGGFLKLGSGYLKALYVPPTFVNAGDVQISEVLYQPNAAIDTTGEWFEVTNRATGPIDLNGWVIDFAAGSSHTISSSVVVAPGAAVVLGQSPSGALNDGVATTYQYGTTFSMPQPAGSLTLKFGTYATTSTWNSATANNGGVGVSVGVQNGDFILSTDTTTTVPHPIRCSSGASFGTQTPQQLGTPGTAGSCFGYVVQSIPVSYSDITTTGTLHTTGDSVVLALDISAAPLTFFGAAQTSVAVSTNGFLRFKPSTDSGTTNRVLPSTAASGGSTLAIFWDDLDSTGAADSNVYVKRIAAGADPANPGAHWIFQWSHYERYGFPSPTGDDLNFQIKFFDTGVIEYHYAAMVSGTTNSYANGNNATVWLENVAGNTALVQSVNKPLVVPQSAFRFTPN